MKLVRFLLSLYVAFLLRKADRAALIREAVKRGVGLGRGWSKDRILRTIVDHVREPKR